MDPDDRNCPALCVVHATPDNTSRKLRLEECDGESTLEEIPKRMTAAFEIDFSTAISDVRKVIQQLNDIGLLEATTAQTRKKCLT
jgi:hypothetical protein